ncbi:hypothetical protein AEB_P3381 [Altererythrobacter sp. B11]|uniref:beta strand repeat-containing protein n=1 Tax=Altererythrobacter sp. B11 TaxID=2060312 RepID=UPI000DC6F904|nr:autotransporter domain-containing protein [Altererythrobacter sp. B11]BBC74249.1 hypothetical protein AEB_P3381 [Altererythrobacter sp. B11]
MNANDTARGARRTRTVLRAGTALPFLLGAWPLLAQPITEDSAQDIDVSVASASGTPVAIELTSGGSITASVTEVTATAQAADRDHVIGLETSGGGAISGTFGSIVGTGDGELVGIEAAGAGDITLQVGSLDLAGTATAGIAAHSSNGSVLITADSVIARGTGEDSQQEFYEAVLATSDNGSVTVNVGSSETFGQYASAIVVSSGGQAIVTADSAAIHSEGAVAVSVVSAGDASADLGAVTSTATTGQGVFVQSSGGDASLNVDSIEIGSDSEAARVLAAGDIDVTIGSIQAGGGLTARSTGGDTTVLLTGEIVGSTYGGMEATGQNVSVTMASGSSITAAGAMWNGIFASGEQSVSISATNIQSTGRSIEAVSDGAVDINVAGNTHSSGSVAIEASGSEVTIATAAGTITSGQTGISATGTSNVAITNGGAVSAGGDVGSAIWAQSQGPITVVSETVSVTGAGADPGVRSDGSNLRLEQGGIIVEQTGGTTNAPITVDAGSVTVAGQHRYGISVRGGSAITVTADDVSLESADAVAVVARGGAGAVSITTGTVTTTGASGVGVFGNSTTGAVTINAGVTRVENTGLAGPFSGDAVFGSSGSGTVSITSADAFSAGAEGSAVVALSAGDVSIVSGRAETSGADGTGILAQSTSGDAVVESTNLITSGADTLALGVFASNGRAAATTGDVTATGSGATGVVVTGRQAEVLVHGTVRSTQTAVMAQSLTGSADVLVQGAVESTAGQGVVVIGLDGMVEVAQGATVTAASAGVVLLGGPQGGFLDLYNYGTISSSGAAAIAAMPLNAQAAAPDIYILNNGTLTGHDGVAVLTGSGDDTLELQNASQIDGIVDLGDGDDRLYLDIIDGSTQTSPGQVVATRNVEGLSVDTGTWRASGTQSLYDFVDLEEGATLIVAENSDGELAILASEIELEGELHLELISNEDDGDLGGSTITGAGSLHLTGPARIELADASGLQHTGGTFVENGELLLTTVYGGDITTKGDGVFQLGEGGDFTGDLVNDGTFVFARTDDYSFVGDFSGSGRLTKQGSGTLTFAGLYAFTGVTNVMGGEVAFAGQLGEDTELELDDGVVDLSQVEGGQQQIAQLSGQGGVLNLGETKLTIEQFGNTVFAGSITGMGELVKTGQGDLKLNGDGRGFTGTGQVSGGTLSVNGDFSNAGFTVEQGGKLGGAGTVGATQVNGGTLAPGNSIDTLTVNGNVTFNAASIFEVEVDAAGAADLLQATGAAALGGASVSVIAASGSYRPVTDYTILTAAGGINGTFGAVSTNLAFLDPSLSYSANAVTLRLVRNDTDFAAYGTTASQRAIASLIESQGYGTTLYDAALTLIDADATPSFASLTGEIYPAYGAAIVETAEMLRRQSAGSLGGEGSYVWASALYNNVSSGHGAGAIKLDGKGVVGGLGFGAGGFSAAAGVGLLDEGQSGGDFSDGDITFAIGQLAYHSPAGLAVSAGVQFGWMDGSTRRSTSLGSVTGSVSGKAKGDYRQVFGEVGYRAAMAGFALEPFAGVSHVATDFDPVAETGAATALVVNGLDRDVTFGTVGLRFSGEGEAAVRPFGSAAYRHAWGDRGSAAAVGFAGLPGTAAIAAVPISRNAAVISAGLSARLGTADLRIGYDGTYSNGFNDHGLTGSVKIRF